ncbi:methyltransferase domain-containing protein [Helicobacter sp. T3_23-1056]
MINLIPKEAIEKHRKNKNMFFCPYCNRMTISPKNIKAGIKMCAICASFERQRFLYFVYENLFLNTDKPLKILHFAPEKCIYDRISKNPNLAYTACDLEPKNYPYIKNIDKQDGCNLTYENNSFDIIIHNHILEHVPNPIKLLQENLRILKQDGIIIASIPYYPNDLCDESKTTDEDRIKYYGQADHLRKFGKDFLDIYSKSFNIKMIDSATYGGGD